MTHRTAWRALLAAALLLPACDTLESGTFEPEVVVESYQVADEPLGQIRLSRTAPIDATYDLTALAITDAAVAVDLLAEDGSVESTYTYTHDPSVLGVYRADDAAALVQPLRRYRLRADIPGEEPVRGETLVPGRFVPRGVNQSCVVYQGTDQFEVTVTRSEYPGRQSYYLFTTEVIGSIDENRLTPTYAQFFDSDEDELEDFRKTASPLFNEANYNPDFEDEFVIELAWLALVFYGEQEITAQALDDNFFDFIRSANVQQGGSTLSPGQIPNVLVNLDGARGLFGSLARNTLSLYVARENLSECPGN